MVSTFLVGERRRTPAEGRNRRNQRDQSSSAVNVLTEADVKDVRDAIEELVSETQTKPFLVDAGFDSGAPVSWGMMDAPAAVLA